jgi:hypothetical protein
MAPLKRYKRVIPKNQSAQYVVISPALPSLLVIKEASNTTATGSSKTKEEFAISTALKAAVELSTTKIIENLT